MDEHKTIKQCQLGNRQAEKELFYCYASKILTLCRRYATSEQEARDFMQEVFIHVFDNIKKYNPTKGVFEAWLYQVATNKVLEQLRKKRQGLKIVYMDNLPELVVEEENLISTAVSTELLLICIQELPDGYREILNLFIFEGLKHKEIASILEISESTSRSQFSRAKNLLKQIIEKKRACRYERC